MNHISVVCCRRSPVSRLSLSPAVCASQVRPAHKPPARRRSRVRVVGPGHRTSAASADPGHDNHAHLSIEGWRFVLRHQRCRCSGTRDPGNWEGTWSSQYIDYEVITIDGKSFPFEESPQTIYWSFWLNNKYAAKRECATERSNRRSGSCCSLGATAPKLPAPRPTCAGHRSARHRRSRQAGHRHRAFLSQRSWRIRTGPKA